jgi:ankyrin repeat protein
MQALQERQKELELWAKVLSQKEETVDDRVARVKHVQYVEHQHLFGVQFTSLHKAAHDGDISGLKHFLEHKGKGHGNQRKVRVDDYDKFGQCAIHYACEGGHMDSLLFLIKHGSAIDIRTTDGMTPLMFACKNNHVHLIQYLIRNGANPLAVNRANQTAAHFTIQGDHYESLEALYDELSKFKEALTRFVEKGDEIKGTESEGKKKKKTAPKEGGGANEAEEEVELDKDKRPKLLKTAQKLVAELLIIPADVMSIPTVRVVDSPARTGWTPLLLAADINSVFCVRTLICLGANIHHVDSTVYGDTAAHKCARNKHYTIYEMLQAAGADIKKQNNMKETPQDLKKDALMFY